MAAAVRPRSEAEGTDEPPSLDSPPVHEDLVGRLRTTSLRIATSVLATLFGVGALLGIPLLVSGEDPPAFIAPFLVSAISLVAWQLARRGHERLARRLFVTTMIVDLLSLMLFAPTMVKVGLGFPLSILTVFMFHLTHPPSGATRLGMTMVGVLLVGYGVLLAVDAEALSNWMLVTSMVAQLMVLGFSTLVLRRLGRDWLHALAEADQARRQLVDAHRLAMQASYAKSNFLATMSHELRTPLNAVIGYAELAAEEGSGNLSDLERIQAAGHHLLKLVDQVLDLSRIESGKVEFESREVELDMLVRDVCDILRPQVQSRQNRLRLELAPVVRNNLDPLRTRQILTNLLGNAIKFTENGTIEVSVSEAQGCQRVTIRDDGPGIPSERLEDIFAPFEQATRDVQINYGGTGLGLAISRRLAEEMGGRLWAESEVGEGATFVFELPTRLAVPAV